MPLVTTTSGARTYTINGLTIKGGMYKFIVRAVNSIGESSNSIFYGVIAAGLPDPPISFVRNEALTTKTQVAFSWSSPPDNGGSPVLDYTI